MGNSSKLTRNDIIIEAMIKAAEIEVMQEELDALPSLEELNEIYKPSEVLEENIRLIIAKDKKAKSRKRLIKRFAKVAAIIGVIFTTLTTILMTVEASRVFILNTFISLQDDHIAFEFSQSDPSDIVCEIVLGFVPEGFGFTSSQIFDKFSLDIYENADGKRLIIQRHFATTLSASVDNEIREFVATEVAGEEAFLFEAIDSGYPNVLMWAYGDEVISIISDINIDIMFTIAENISLK